MRPAAALAALLGLAAAPAAALAEKACFISYSGFEEKIAHLDLDACPGAQVKPEEGFCRIGLDGSALLVYTFRHTDGEPCLARVDRWEFNDFASRFGTNYEKP
ncbi:MAG: hypothetical protein AVDCRST_MAG08-4594 [uncultured Acetobacteraceae bacterium]|uniref:Uncharacterized protein n=1 Tax=uncultured Acetobacteraceae bacterium TaxID=169975 RepID=A0A6J4JXW3_9PROT|nr:MAG: hypothetical protein AVDCRST_MAG08-4594 [uncultured Acetobacteraceae bacterium]